MSRYSDIIKKEYEQKKITEIALKCSMNEQLYCAVMSAAQMGATLSTIETVVNEVSKSQLITWFVPVSPECLGIQSFNDDEDDDIDVTNGTEHVICVA